MFFGQEILKINATIILCLVLLNSVYFSFLPSAQAATETLFELTSYRAHASSTLFSYSIDATNHTNLSFSFGFDATTLDFGPPQDSFSYGYLSGEDEYILGTFLGLAGSSTEEVGVININLPEAAAVSDLVVFVSVAANSSVSSDKVELRDIKLTAEPKPVIIDVCPNIDEVQEIIPEGYEYDGGGNCVLIPPPVVDVCPNLEGGQAVVPEGYEYDEEGNCVVTPPVVVDICPNLEGTQEVIPDGYVLDTEENCVKVNDPDFPPHPNPNSAHGPKYCPRGFAKWIDRFTDNYTWRADDVYQAVVLVGGPKEKNLDKAEYLYIAGPTEVGDVYGRRFHKIALVCVR